MRSIVVGVLSVMMASWLPVVFLSPVEVAQPENRLLIVEKEHAVSHTGTITEIRLQTGGNIVTMPVEAYLTGVVLSEMPISFHEEALKAQAVAARTFAQRQLSGGKHADYDLCDQSSCCQAWSSPERLREKLGEGWGGYAEKAAQAVSQTEGRVLMYDGSPIEAVYFSCSGGVTEAAVAVWGSEVPYLQSVDSPGEEGASKYRSSVEIPLADFRACLPQSDLTGNPSGWFGEIQLTEGGGVASMEIGGTVYAGTELRSIFGLNSTMFSVAVTENAVEFEVFGYGHRVGMSQYGANAMAEDGKTYEEILMHYYPGAVLQ